MSNPKFKTFEGQWPCHTCKEVVPILRLWLETADVTWMCSNKHISKVQLIKTKKDYERENRK